MLGPRVALAPAAEAVKEVMQQGVALVQGVLSYAACQRLRAFVLEELAAARRIVATQPSEKFKLFSRDIRETRASEAAPETRFELQLPIEAEPALLEVLQGEVGQALESLAGLNASLWEFTAMASWPQET